MILWQIIEVCKVRADNNIACKGCKYRGTTCDHAKNILRVDRPSEYDNLKLNKEEK